MAYADGLTCRQLNDPHRYPHHSSLTVVNLVERKMDVDLRKFATVRHCTPQTVLIAQSRVFTAEEYLPPAVSVVRGSDMGICCQIADCR